MTEFTEFTAPLLEMQGIVKRYGATTALNGVDFDVRQGEIHALLGENGAGKSTLMHILAGLTRPDAGDIRFQGKTVHINSPRNARRRGIAMVHQHFTLVPDFTVAENLALDTQSSLSGFRKLSAALHYAPSRESLSALERARSLGWELSPNARISDLPVGTQQRVEIIKALATDARLLIFDEPTAVLAGGEVEELFTVLRRLRDEGQAVVLIAHKLAEIMAVADRVTVLRRGNRVASASVPDTTVAELAAWMMGASPVPFAQSRAEEESSRKDAKTQSKEKEERIIPSADDSASLQANSPASASVPSLPPAPYILHPQNVSVVSPSQEPALRVSSLVVLGDRGEQALQRLSLEVRRGEIFGIGGVDGNGQTELAEALVGLRPLKAGSLLWDGQASQPGLLPTTGYIPQDRRRVGLAVTMSIEDNLLFDAVREPQYRSGFFLRRRALGLLADELIQKYDIRIPGKHLPASSLSGGNQQKIVVARALRSHPQLIVAVNPTRGLDIGATRFVHEQLRQARSRGAAVALISTDLDEIAALADRAAILSRGTLTEQNLEPSHADEIGLLLGGVTP